jgi:hypothetical protein
MARFLPHRDGRLGAIRIAIRQLTAEAGGRPQATIIGDVVQAWQQTRIGSTIRSRAGGTELFIRPSSQAQTMEVPP